MDLKNIKGRRTQAVFHLFELSLIRSSVMSIFVAFLSVVAKCEVNLRRRFVDLSLEFELFVELVLRVKDEASQKLLLLLVFLKINF